jgi:hypothetical protein
MLNIIGRLQNVRRNPININGTLVLKRCDFRLYPLLQLCQERTIVRNAKEKNKETKEAILQYIPVPRKKLCLASRQVLSHGEEQQTGIGF